MFKINNIKNGVSATLTGFNSKEINDKIVSCQEGSCECACDPELMKKIEGIEVSGDENETNIIIRGDVDAKTLAPMMQECLITKEETK